MADMIFEAFPQSTGSSLGDVLNKMANLQGVINITSVSCLFNFVLLYKCEK
jgi:hypothetical protein